MHRNRLVASIFIKTVKN